MGFADIVIMAVILGGAALLFYRSAIKKKGHCQGCDSGACSKKPDQKHGKAPC